MSNIHEIRITALLKRYSRTHPKALDDFNEEHFATFLATQVAPFVIASTWRAYRSSCNSGYMKNEEALTILTNAISGQKKNLVNKTSSLRAKKVSVEDLTILADFAEYESEKDSRSKGDFALRWLIAGLLTGLRPHEWMQACLHEKKLHVANTKLRKCVDKDWADRYLDLTHLNIDELTLIDSLLKEIQKRDGLGEGKERFEKLRRRATAWLRKANIILFPRRKRSIGLMTGRHQFIANLKASGRYTPAEIAYLVGHASDWRAYESYGRKKDGMSNKRLPKISKEQQLNIAKVREHHDAKVNKIKRCANHQLDQ